MANENKERYLEFIKINHYLMTAAEMAEELGATHTYINQLCSELGVKAIKEGDRIIEFIQKHLDWTQQRVAEYFNITVTAVKYQLEKAGIILLTDKELEIKKKDGVKAIIQSSNKSASGKATFYSILSDDAKEYLSQISAFRDTSKPPLKRHPAIYNQSGSQFTDELYNITTTKRVTPSAQDAFFK